MFVGDKRQKPARWAWQPGLVEPDWIWALDNTLLMSLVFWDKGGNDLSPFRRVLSVQAGAPNIVGSRRGHCIDFDGSEGLGVPRIDIPNDNLAVGAVFELDAFGTAFDQDIIFRQADSNTIGYVLEVEDSKIIARAGDGGGLPDNRVVSVNTLTAGVTYAAIWTFNGGVTTGRLVYLGSDGSFENIVDTSLPDTYANGTDATSHIGGRPAADQSDGRIYCINLWSKFLSEQQCLQWVRDPFGIFRMEDEVIWRVPAAIPTIHLTMPPYIPA